MCSRIFCGACCCCDDSSCFYFVLFAICVVSCVGRLVVMLVICVLLFFFFFKQKTAYEMRISDWSSDVCSSDLKADLYAVWQALVEAGLADVNLDLVTDIIACPGLDYCSLANARSIPVAQKIDQRFADLERQQDLGELKIKIRSEEHKSELQSLMRTSYAVFCLKKKKHKN